jgi:TetR/AcrR family transcriptional regulator, transcriptional repressor for nem operon
MSKTPALSKAEATKQKIVEQAAHLFNQQGFAGASMADLMAATGLKKGGIYNHFASKEELAIAAFDYAIEQVQLRYRNVLRQERHSLDRLIAIVHTFRDSTYNPVVQGGCPILNLAIDSDDTNPVLRDRAKQAMDDWRSLICKVIERGIKQGEMQASIAADQAASIIISTLEGAMMMTKLYDDPIHLERAAQHLSQFIKTMEA